MPKQAKEVIARDLPDAIMQEAPKPNERVVHPDLPPWNAIVRLMITRPDGGAELGTGWLYRPNVVVTAGHCVFCNTRKYHERMRAIAVAGASALSTTGLKWECSNDCKLQSFPDVDYGVVRIDRPLAGVTPFDVAPFDDADLDTRVACLAGFEGDEMHTGNAGLHAFAQHLAAVFYDLSTARGWSGGPVWFEEPGGRHTVVAIHTGAGGPPERPNRATRLTTEIIADLESMISVVGAS